MAVRSAVVGWVLEQETSLLSQNYVNEFRRTCVHSVGGLDANRTTQTAIGFNRRGGGAAQFYGSSGAPSAGIGPARTSGAGMCRGAREPIRGEKTALLARHGGQVAVAVSQDTPGRALRRAATGSTAQGQR